MFQPANDSIDQITFAGFAGKRMYVFDKLVERVARNIVGDFGRQQVEQHRRPLPRELPLLEKQNRNRPAEQEHQREGHPAALEKQLSKVKMLKWVERAVKRHGQQHTNNAGR